MLLSLSGDPRLSSPVVAAPVGVAALTLLKRAYRWIRRRRTLAKKAELNSETAPLFVSEDEVTRTDQGAQHEDDSEKGIGQGAESHVMIWRTMRLLCVLGLISLSVRDLMIEDSGESASDGLVWLIFYVS